METGMELGMDMSIIAAALWGIAANVLAMLPSKDNYWTRAYVLIALGLPILAWVTWNNGPWVGLVVLLAAMWMLRWPVRYLGRWIRRRLRPGGAGGAVNRGARE